MAALSDYLENKIVDWLLRGQAYTPPATVYVGLHSVTPTDVGGGTEVSATGYARVAIASSLANWAGTQGAGTTVASTGTGGTTSNNSVITFPAPNGTNAWGTVNGMGVYDALTGGNLLFYAALASPKTINATDPAPSFAAAALTLQIDN